MEYYSYKYNNRKYCRKEACLQQHLLEFFLSKGLVDFLDDISIFFIDKTYPKDANK